MKLRLSVYSSVVLVAVCLVLWGVGRASARSMLTLSHGLPIQVKGLVRTLDCQNSPGPQITIEGGITTEGLGLRLIFQNNVKGTHTRVEETHQDIGLLQTGAAIVIPKQPVLGGVGGNPFIWLQMTEADGTPIGDEIFLGRCVQGLFNLDQGVLADTLTRLGISVSNCENSPGPFITVDGGLSFTSGLSAKLIFRNNDNPVGGPHKAEASINVSLIPAGLSITFPKQPVQGGVGGNPHIWAQLIDGNGDPIEDPVYLGRCVQLSKN